MGINPSVVIDLIPANIHICETRPDFHSLTIFGTQCFAQALYGGLHHTFPYQFLFNPFSWMEKNLVARITTFAVACDAGSKSITPPNALRAHSTILSDV